MSLVSVNNSRRFLGKRRAIAATAGMLCFYFAFSICLQAQTAPSTYSAYTGTDAKPIPPAPALGPANSVFNDPTFGSPILRVTDANTNSGESFVSSDSGFQRTWNADSTAIKLMGPHGDGWWLEFNASTFKVGDGSSHPVPHSVPFGSQWEWSTVDPDIIYFLNGNQIAKYNKATGVKTNLGGPANGHAVTYAVAVIGQDNWVCSAAGPGAQNTYTEIYCVNPTSPATYKFIDVYHKTINGVLQGDPNWPMSAAGQVIGVHDISGGTGSRWLEVTFHQVSWGANGGAVLDLGTNTWSEITNADIYWGGHVSMGNGRYANSSGSKDGKDSRGIVLRDPDNAMNSTQYQFVGQPAVTNNHWCDADHLSWLNSMTNPGAPIFVSRYMANVANCAVELTGEIYAAAVDGSGTIYRFAHNHDGGCFYGQGFAQVSNDGNWALFSSYWDGKLGPDTAFGCQTRIDTFIIQLTGVNTSSSGGSTNPLPPPAITTTTLPAGTQNVAYAATLSATGGTTPYAWSVASGSLPPGLTLAASTGTVSGIPTGSGTSTFAARVVDATGQTASATFNLVVAAASSSGGTASNAIALVQSAKVEGSGVASVSVGFPSGNQAGNLIVAFVRMSTSSQTVSLKDSLGNTYTDAVAQVQMADGHQVHLLYAKNIRGGANTVTASFSGTNNYPLLAVYEYSGLDAASPLDQKASAQGSGTIAGAGPTAATSIANELVFAGVGGPASFTGTIGAGAGYSLALSGAKSRAATESGKLVASQTVSAGFTLSASANWSVVLATFKAASSSSTSGGSSSGSTSGGTGGGSGSTGGSTGTATIAMVQSNAVAGTGVASVSAPFTSSNTKGNLIIAFVRMSTTSQTVAVRDSAGNVYSDSVSQSQATDGHQVHLFYAKNIAGGANTVTASFSAANNHPWLAVYEFSGLSATSPLDQTAHAQGSGATASSGMTATTTSANELIFSGGGLPASYGGTATAGSGYTMLQQNTSSSTAASEGAVVSSTGSFAGTVGLSPGTYWSAVVATFK
jgi:hypothetical protein